MEQEKNDLLLDDLFEAKGGFDNLIQEMMDKGISFPYEDNIKQEEMSYANAFNAISRMNGYTEEYNYLVDANEDFLVHEVGIYAKYTLLYCVSIVIIKLFSKTLSYNQINEMWYAIIGLILGSVNMGIINKNINNHRYGTKESRELMNRLSTLKENYKVDYDTAMKEIESMYFTNRKLWKELDNEKEKQIIKK